MLNTEFSPWPSYTEEEADAVRQVLLSNRVNYWTGSECRDFETNFAAWVGTSYAIALGNGTLALDAALSALGIGPGDEVVVTPRTFLASVSSVVNTGATPVFADVDMDSQNIESHTIEPVLSSATKAIVVVHLGGRPADMDAIMALAEAHNLFVIEDCAQAHGAKYKGRAVGSIGHIGCWSFCQDKIMTTGGEGGMVTTNNEAWWRHMWSLKDHGKSYAAVYEREHEPGYRWLHESFGTNWRMTEMQAVIGNIQLGRMQEWTSTRQRYAQLIKEACADFKVLRTPSVPDYIEHACYKHYAFVVAEELAAGWTRDRIVSAITQRGVPCYTGACAEVYLEKAFDNTPYRPEQRLMNAQELGDTSVMFLVHPTLTVNELTQTCEVIREILTQAQRTE